MRASCPDVCIKYVYCFSACFFVSVLKNANLSAGGHVILAARDKYLEALSELVKLASLQVSLKPIKVQGNFLTAQSG